MDRRYCFSHGGRPKNQPSLQLNLPTEIKVVAGQGGASCDQVCAAEESTCSPQFLKVLNTCDVLRDVFGCEAGCGFSDPSEKGLPGYIVSSAPKPHWPAYCAIFGDGSSSDDKYDCWVEREYTRRICPCDTSKQPVIDDRGEEGNASDGGNGGRRGDDGRGRRRGDQLSDETA
jgi:hypothetical protein